MFLQDCLAVVHIDLVFTKMNYKEVVLTSLNHFSSLWLCLSIIISSDLDLFNFQ